MTSLIAVYTTTDSPELAERLARDLVQARLAACVHIESIESVYEWAGKLEHAREWRLMCKTVQGRYADLAAAIAQRHNYALPALYALPITDASPAYQAWVEAQTTPPPDPEA
jgi:periplasmic divalent cation tolerance protein